MFVLLSKLQTFGISTPIFCTSKLIHTTVEACAARKGTREKARKKKIKVEVKKIGFIPHNLRNLEKLKAMRRSRRTVIGNKEEPIDQVYSMKLFKRPSYKVSDVVLFHREVNHPSMLNQPNAPVNVTMELNMVAEKKTRFIESFTRIVNLPHPFGSYDDRTVLALGKTPEQIEEATQAGADLAGGVELIQKIQTGELLLHDFKYVVCHPAILPELIPVRGLLKRKFPTAKSGTLGADLSALLVKFKKGLQYRCAKDEDQHDLGIINAQIGALDMDSKALEENFAALLTDVQSVKPRRGGDFVTFVWCRSPPSPEKFIIDFAPYLPTQAAS